MFSLIVYNVFRYRLYIAQRPRVFGLALASFALLHKRELRSLFSALEADS